MTKNLAHMFRAILASLCLATAGISSAQVLYGADGGGGNPATNLLILNPATGAVTSIVGPIGMAVTGMAFHPVTGVLYGSTGGNSPVNPRSIITINTTTGAGTLVGATGLGNPLADLSFRADGTLFGWSEAGDDLATVNLATGVATIVSDSGLATAGSGLTFSGATLFFAGNGASGDFYTINPATGLSTVISTLNGAPLPGGQIAAMASNGGTIFAVNTASAGLGSATNLVTINTATGAVTNLGASSTNLDAIVFGPAPAPGGPNFIPTLSEWAMLLLFLGMLTLASRRLKAQRPR